MNKIELFEEKILYHGDNGYHNDSEIIFGQFFTDYPNNDYVTDGEVGKYSLSDDAKIYTDSSSEHYCGKQQLYDVVDVDLKKLFGIDSLRQMFTEDGEYDEDLFMKFENQFDAMFGMFQLIAMKDLQSKGYDGAHWTNEDDLTPDQYQIWNEDKIKFVEKIQLHEAKETVSIPYPIKSKANAICAKYSKWQDPSELRNLWGELEKIGITDILIKGYPDTKSDGTSTWFTSYKYKGKEVDNSQFVYSLYEGSKSSQNEYNMYFS